MNGEKLTDILRAVKPEKKPEPPADADQEDLGPCVQVFPKGAKAIDIEDGPRPVISFQYVYISVRSEFRPDHFIFLFMSDKEHWKLVVHGRNLRDLYNRINDHCVRKVRRHDRDFGQDDGKPFISQIEVVTLPMEDRRQGN